MPEGVESERGDGDIYGEPEPAGWRRIKLRAEKVDGSFAEVELLRPISWLEGQDARVGATVDISVPECGIDGNALVLAIEQCPAIVPGPGWVVTGTFAHQSASAVDVHVEGLNGPIGTTANHPFWSEDRQEFVRADDLQPGERLRTVAGAPEVLAVIPRAPPEPVYNLEVQYAHVYHVAADGVLVHNGKRLNCKALARKRALLATNRKAGIDWERKIRRAPPPGHDAAEQVTLRVKTPQGTVRIRADQIIRNRKTGALSLIEGKSSATAGYTRNQRKALEHLRRGGSAEVRGLNGRRAGLRSGQIVQFQDILDVRPTGVSVLR